MKKELKEQINIFKSKATWLNLLTLFVFTVASIVLELICLELTTNALIVKFKTLIGVGAVVLTILMLALSFLFYAKKKDSWYKLFISLYVLLIFVLTVLIVMIKSGFFNVVSSPEKFAAYLEGAGGWMPIAFIVLQFLQVLILPIPSFVSVAAGVALFGAPLTLLYSFLAIVPASIVGFFIGRKLGRRAVSWMIGEQTLEKWQNKLKGKDNLILTTMFLLPLFPDDILCFVAGLSSMSNKYFLGMIFVCRLVNLTWTSFSLDFIPFNTWWGLLIWGVLGIIFILAFAWIYKNTDKINEWAAKRKSKSDKEEKNEE